MKKSTIAFILLAALLVIVYIYLTPKIIQITGVDWNETYSPAARALASGHNPYTAAPNLRNPVWILIPCIPLAFLPQRLSTLLALFFTLSIYIFIPYRLRASPIAFIVFLLSPSVIHSFQMTNVDSLVLLGFIMPAPIGLFFVLAKPQMGLGITIYWLVEAWREGGFRKVIITFAPVTIALMLSFVIFGNWINMGKDKALLTAIWNMSIFPWGIPIGLIMLVLAFLYKKKYLAASASPFFAPYMFLPSWSAALVGFFQNDLAMIGAVLAMWIMFFVHLSA